MSRTLEETIGSITLRPAQKVAERQQEQSAVSKPVWFSQTGKPDSEYPYAKYLPTFDPSLKLPPLELFRHVDPGHEALKLVNPRAFLDGAEVEDVTPSFGSEVDGIQLSKLDTQGRQQLGKAQDESGEHS